jgi:1,4-dihydroxy-2-naphthoate octaprenyltransferase
VYRFTIFLTYAYLGFLVVADDADPWLLLAFASAPLAVPLDRAVWTRTDGPSLNAALAGTGRLLAAFALLLSAGLLLSQ